MRPFPKSAAGRAPRVWVRRLVVWHDIDTPPFRDIRLRRGLNIIWSPSGETAEDENLPLGHAAGKTLLCRALRHCLGEASFAGQDDSQLIRGALPRGAVGAEVVVDDEVWAVRRSFVGGSDLAARDVDVTSLAESDSASAFEDYVSALQGTLGDAARLANYPFPEGHRPWQFALAWLTRDQECRVDGIASWRHKDTGSRSPVRSSSADDRLTVLRVALDAYDTRARERASKIATVECSKKAAEMVANRAGSERDALVMALAGALGTTDDQVRPPSLGEALLMKEYRDRLEGVLKERTADLRKSSAPNLDHLDDARLATLEAKLAGLGEQLEREQSAVNALREERALYAKKRPQLDREFSESKHPTCPYDGTPLDVEKSKFACPLVKFPDRSVVAAELDRLKQRGVELQNDLDVHGPRLEATKRAHRTLLSERDALARRVKQRLDAEALERASHDAAMRAALGASSLLERVLNSVERAATGRRAVATIDDELGGLRDEENKSRASQDVHNVAAWFQQLVNRVLGNHVNGSVRLDGNGLHVEIDQRSVALNSPKVVLFDLAAMLCAAENTAFLPAFLLHDSPREGDLDPSTYRRIFRAIYAMAPDPDAASFQYIITTTSPPPGDLPRDLVYDELASAPKSRRFHGVNL